MSFGFSVGDILAVIQLANKLRREFADSPDQFKAISDEYVYQKMWLVFTNEEDGNRVRSLSIVLLDVDASFSVDRTTDSRKSELRNVLGGC